MAEINILFFCLFLTFACCQNVPPTGYPPCLNSTDLENSKYMDSTSVQSALKLCFERILDPLMYPGYVKGSLMNLSISFNLNNLIEVNEVKNTITLDFFINMQWIEPRLNMPDFWTQWFLYYLFKSYISC
jgi:hypothetical protein